MWGSDWPVLTMADNYSNWFDLAMNYCNSFSEDEKNKIFSRNATQFYSL
jgi:L-fuconolactonase